MKKRIKDKVLGYSAFMCGVASAFNIYGSTQSHQALRTHLRGLANMLQDAEDDRANLANDWQNVGNDLRTAIDKHEVETSGKS